MLNWLTSSLFFICFIFGVPKAKEQNQLTNNERIIEESTSPDFLKSDSTWALETLENLSIEERIAQLCFMRSESVRSSSMESELLSQIKNYGIGGVTFFKGDTISLKALSSQYESASKLPLLFSIDGEWGANMRLSELPKYPWMMTLGAVQNHELIEEMAAQMAEEFKALNIHINLAPDVDVNNNPQNPIINSRSFGENKINVARKAQNYIKGLEKNQVAACIKHFPGHGDTDMDSHLALPQLPFGMKRLDSLELFPFRKCIDGGVSAVMIAHLDIPKITGKQNLPSSLSKVFIDSLLKTEMGFQGIVMTDGLAMKGVQDHYENGRLELEALKAGNDVLLLPQNLKAVIDTVKKGIETKEYTLDELNKSCFKVLMLKSYLNLHQKDSLPKGKIDHEKAQWIKEQLMAEAFTLVHNPNQVIPFQSIEKQLFKLVSFGDIEQKKVYEDGFDFFVPSDKKHFSSKGKTAEFDHWLSSIPDSTQLIVSIHKSDKSPWKAYKLSDFERLSLEKLSKRANTHLIHFANPYALLELKFLEQFTSFSVAYQNNMEANKLAAQFLFGARSPKGKLPVSISKAFPESTGLHFQESKQIRLGNPMKFGLRASDFQQIDSIANATINDESTPGCQLIMAKDGEILFNKNYGFQTYENKKAITNTSVYDLASITKMASTTSALMMLYDEGKLDLDQTLETYLEESKNTNKADISIRSILAHQAKFKPWIPFYLKTLEEDKSWKKGLYSKTKSSHFETQVADNMFVNNLYKDSILTWIYESELLDSTYYRYSDLGFYLLKELVEKKSKLSLNQLVENTLFQPIGAYTLGYLPKTSSAIVPSEIDTYFRHQSLKGEVHDMGAAMLGGVAGHAGLFGRGIDLAKLMQVYLQKGQYGGKQYFDQQTIEQFTACAFCNQNNRRGLGFDKPLMDEEGGPAGELASAKSFGHSGFTGTFAWADPENQMIFIFLSNRTYPTMENKRLVTNNVRTKLHDEFYKLFLD
ncbi:MAG: glycoside hydrolase family 3 N-terminal domain-containing protein [Flavobacteriales bacterium]